MSFCEQMHRQLVAVCRMRWNDTNVVQIMICTKPILLYYFEVISPYRWSEIMVLGNVTGIRTQYGRNIILNQFGNEMCSGTRVKGNNFSSETQTERFLF
jgi:hypothetical protein